MPTAPEGASRTEVQRHQQERLTALVRAILPQNRFYSKKFAGLDLASIRRLADLARLPFTTKAELLADQKDHPPYGTNLTFALDQYVRLHQTSGTSGKPLRWLDTASSWSSVLDCWAAIFRIVGLKPSDRLFFPFSFGPFLAFWSAFESAGRAGYFVLPSGGMATTTRLQFLLDNAITVVLCTPTYALHLAEVAKIEGFDLAGSGVRALIVAGEPGGSVLGTRQRLESAWGARVFDHSGMTEIGPACIECPARPGGLHVIEDYFIAEVIDPTTGEAVAPGTRGELVLTNLVRWGMPLLRYRTGDLVCADLSPCPCGSAYQWLDGGIRGRIDDMIVLRGNNVYPEALQSILHRFPEVVEYRVEVDRTAALHGLRIDVELTELDQESVVARIDRALRDELFFRADVRCVPAGSLPRFEQKARRVVFKNPAV